MVFCFFRSLLAPPFARRCRKKRPLGSPSLLATCTCCFAPQTEATHLTSRCDRRAFTHNLSVCHGTQECGSLLAACSSSSVLLCSCSAAVLFSAGGTPFYLLGPVPVTLLPPTPQHPVQTEPPPPCPTFPLTSLAKPQMIVSTQKQGRLDLFCTKKKEIKTSVFLFSLPLRVCDSTLSMSHSFNLCCLYFILFLSLFDLMVHLIYFLTVLTSSLPVRCLLSPSRLHSMVLVCLVCFGEALE